jgi:hypothetical protein
MPRYAVEIAQTLYGSTTVVVEARNEDEAYDKALDMSGDETFHYHADDYEMESCKLVED